jgi:tRNA (cytosine38-C5)-methyltransferase
VRHYLYTASFLAPMPKVLELFSGIGGMRAGLSSCLGGSLKFTAVDLNEFCNEIYYETYKERPLTMDITSLDSEWFDSLAADIWTMSPPCQPYTRQGSMKDTEDDRARPLLHLIRVLEEMRNMPGMIIVENVKNFEASDSFQLLEKTLRKRGFQLYGYLLNPLYMGFPNSRLRFFLVAKKGVFVEETTRIVCNDPAYPEFALLDTTNFEKRMIREFLCSHHSEQVNSKLTVPHSLLEKKSAFCFDIVSPVSTQCLCFTRSYTKYINGTGSVLYTGDNMRNMIQHDSKNRPIFHGLQSMTELSPNLRYFCPVEVARLNGFSDLSLWLRDGCMGGVKYYRAMGNSLNPRVVEYLVRMHL